jgi:hypothetical protein
VRTLVLPAFAVPRWKNLTFTEWEDLSYERVPAAMNGGALDPLTVHAETGERVLFASPSYIKSIVGLNSGKARSCSN